MVHAKAGALLGAVLKLTGFLMFVIPGMNSRILYTGSAQVSSHVTSYYCCFIMFLFLLHHTYTLVMTYYFVIQQRKLPAQIQINAWPSVTTKVDVPT